MRNSCSSNQFTVEELTRGQKCGDRLFSDVIELQKFGVVHLAERMENGGAFKISTAGFNQRSGKQRYTPHCPFAWFARTIGVCQTNQAANTPISFKTSSTSTTIATCPSSQGSSSQRQMLHLMACMHNKRSSKVLQQDRIEEIATDCELIQFLRRQYRKRRSRLRSFFSLKTVQGIHFVKFHLPMATMSSSAHTESHV